MPACAIIKALIAVSVRELHMYVGYHVSMSELQSTNTRQTLVRSLFEVFAIWILANVGYFTVFPAIGYELDYNGSPVSIAVYFLICASFCIYYFWPLFKHSIALDARIWIESVMSLGLATLLSALLNGLSHLPTLSGPSNAPYTDILLSTPWYFMPKMAEILLQQVLIAVLVLELFERLRSMYRTIIWYSIIFGGGHVFLYAFTNASSQHAAFMTLGALASSFVFPYLLLRVRGGFLFTYTIHVLFYITLALVLHTWPPPGYGV